MRRDAALPLEPFAGQLGSDAHKAWMEECARLNDAYSLRREEYAAGLGRPFPQRRRNKPPIPGVIDNEPGLVEG